MTISARITYDTARASRALRSYAVHAWQSDEAATGALRQAGDTVDGIVAYTGTFADEAAMAAAALDYIGVYCDLRRVEDGVSGEVHYVLVPVKGRAPVGFAQSSRLIGRRTPGDVWTAA